jgi:ABC-type multidrug transport system ATPase subunit
MTLLKLDRVSVSYWRGSTEVPALTDVSLEVAAGELFAVYGKAAAGKTTLLRTAAGLLAPDRGRVLVEEQDLARRSRGEAGRFHREVIGWVERAGPSSSELSVLVYVALPLYRRHGVREAQRRAVAALEKVGAAGCVHMSWKDLPDTDRVLVAIAQAYVHEPKLLVVDDPTYGFAIAARERVVGLLRSMADDDGMAVLMAVPDTPTLLPAHRLRMLHRGRLLAPAVPVAGAPDNVLQFPRDERAN